MFFILLKNQCLINKSDVNSSTLTSDLDHLQNYFESKPLFYYDEEDDNGLW